MRGQLVVVKSFAGPLVRRVWDVDDGAVIVVPDDIFAKLEAGEADVPVVGFPPEDVYEMSSSEVPPDPDWAHMQRWNPREKA